MGRDLVALMLITVILLDELAGDTIGNLVASALGLIGIALLVSAKTSK